MGVSDLLFSNQFPDYCAKSVNLQSTQMWSTISFHSKSINLRVQLLANFGKLVQQTIRRYVMYAFVWLLGLLS